MSEKLTDTEKRFEIFVPNPKARINLGASNDTETGPFGYKGLSLQSDVNLFIDANKHTMFQTGQNYNGQVGGKWLQYSNADMYLSSTTNTNLSADAKITIAAGAGQGQITALDHGSTPRLVAYNNLKLHYTVDCIQTGLYEFFHGRRERFKNITTAWTEQFKHRSKPKLFGGQPAEELESTDDLKGGFIGNSKRSFDDLFPDDAKDNTVYASVTELQKQVLGKEDVIESFYGYSSYFSRFDPYKQKKGDWLHNSLKVAKRVADVAGKLGNLLTDNFLVENGLKLAEAADKGINALNNVKKLYERPEKLWQTDGPEDPTGLVDEAVSGWGARTTHTFDKVFGKAIDTAKTKATVTSSAGPFALEHGDEIEVIQPARGGQATTSAAISAVAASIDGSAAVEYPAGNYWELLIQIDAAGSATHEQITFTFTSDTTKTKREILNMVNGALAGKAIASLGGGDIVTITSASTGVDSSVNVSGSGMTYLFPGGGTATAGTPTSSGTYSGRVGMTAPTIFDGWGTSEPTIHIQCDKGGPKSVGFTGANTRNPETISGAIASATGSDGTVTIDDAGVIHIASSTKGTSSYAHVSGDQTALNNLHISVGRVNGSGNVADVSTVTTDEIHAIISPGLTGVVTKSDDGELVFSSTTTGDGSYVRVQASGSSTMATAIGLGGVEDEVEYQSWDTYDDSIGFFKGMFNDLRSINHELQKLPEDTRNLFRPLTQAIDDTVAVGTYTVGAIDAAKAAFSKAGPGPAETIGLVARDGISLGTQDRIVAAGSKGVVFIVEGEGGGEDYGKFVLGEALVKGALDYCPSSWQKDAPDKVDQVFDGRKVGSPSLGFKVISDSSAELMGTTSAQLLALGRGELDSKENDKKYVGIGVARVAGSRAAELCAHRKVVISARDEGKADDEDGTTGGRVELAGQTIAIGGMNLDGDTKDFKASEGFGIEAPVLAKQYFGSFEEFTPKLASVEWPKKLREEHPNTKHVVVHAEKDTVIVVDKYMVHVSSEDGITVGQRKKNPDAMTNEVDDTKPHFVLDDEGVSLRFGEKNKASTLHLAKDKASLWEGPTKDTAARAQLGLTSGTANLWGGTSRFTAKEGKLKLSAANLSTEADASLKLDGGVIKLG